MKLQWFGIMATFILLGSACQSGGGTSGSIDGKLKEGKKLASRGGVEIHEGFVELLTQVNPNISNQLKTPAGKKRLVDNLLEQELLYQESLKRGIPNNPRYREKAALYERVIFAQGLVEEEIDAKAQDYYNKNKDEEFAQVKISHILIRTKPKRGDREGVDDATALKLAQEVKKKLDSGTPWEEVVKESSEDRLTKNRAGDLGKINRKDRRVQRLQWNDLVDSAFKMKVGEISAPIKAKDGYHVILVTEEVSVAPYEEVQNRIKFKLRGPVKNEVIASLTENSETTYLDEELKNAPEPGARPGMPLPPNLKGKPPLGVKKPTAQIPAPPKPGDSKKEPAPEKKTP